MILFLNEWLEALLRMATELQSSFPKIASKRPISWHQLRSHASDVGGDDTIHMSLLRRTIGEVAA